MERLENQIQDISKAQSRVGTENYHSRFTWFSSGTQYLPHRYPVGKWLDNITLRAAADLEDVMLVIEPDSNRIRKVRVPRYSARPILAKATRTGDYRIFCNSIKWESHQDFHERKEYLEAKKEESALNKGRVIEFFDKDI